MACADMADFPFDELPVAMDDVELAKKQPRAMQHTAKLLYLTPNWFLDPAHEEKSIEMLMAEYQDVKMEGTEPSEEGNRNASPAESAEAERAVSARELLRLRALHCYAHGQYEEALNLAHQVFAASHLRMKPNSLSAMNDVLSRCLVRTGRAAEALPIAWWLVEERNSPDTWFLLGEVYGCLELHCERTLCLARCLKFCPNHAFAWFDMAASLRKSFILQKEAQSAESVFPLIWLCCVCSKLSINNCKRREARHEFSLAGYDKLEAAVSARLADLRDADALRAYRLPAEISDSSSLSGITPHLCRMLFIVCLIAEVVTELLAAVDAYNDEGVRSLQKRDMPRSVFEAELRTLRNIGWKALLPFFQASLMPARKQYSGTHGLAADQLPEDVTEDFNAVEL